ncbi:hypothetical protein HMPREF1624_07069 [Sporothrix schenckii ATCC 58251]|uniref:Uncharacterized protein n=1 Tax=Sporothrix schenckii (strain ATCC 58251 / de Perez 2211183) TaxID=1391915 RepID=U7PQU2_SPOS1|nr:hypothetical protein HMPREF1624_07069 [Sporothrix schenckii ATCC 58251]
MTDAHVRSLLPGSMFGLADDLFQRGLWSIAREQTLRNKEFVASPEFERFQLEQMRMFQADVPPNTLAPFDAELRLWEVLQHRFRCGLDDLFRYGLRPHLPSQRGGGGGDAGFVDYCAKLTAILVHPLWTPDIAHVRWLLQRIVQKRVPGHARPLVPPYSYDKRPFADTARQWGFDASMRMALAGEPETETAASDDNSFLRRLATASREAAHAAAEAEAELAWFFFSASAPRDLWFLDRHLCPQNEPGSGDSGGGGDSKDVDDEEEDTETEENPFGLTVCDSILQGHFGQLADVYEDEATVRQDGRRREDNLVHRTGGRHTRRSPGGGNDAGADDLRDDQVFFDLRLQDLDRLLRLLTTAEFLRRTGFVTPECYYGGYVKAHHIHGYGEDGQDKEKVPRLTCLQCTQKYHQGGGGGAADESDEELQHHHNHDLDHDHDHENDAPGHDDHGHHLHQQFARDVEPHRALEWLLHKKCEWLLAGCRERLIRASLAETEAVDSAATGGNRALLPDIPPFDPPPLALLDRVFTHSSQLAVLERAQDVPHASELWCLRQNETEAEGVY